MIRALFLTSRPLSWVNTAYPFAAAYLLTARQIEHRLDGQPERLATVGVRFTKPVVLPREVGLFVTDEGGLYVGDAPGKAAYLVGDYTVRSSEEEDNNDG